ncbi:MAG: hypothetical protein MJA27_35860, partial [Pseudanabaenales cyanobacterium]|nr:hypothetical protein [Pseudanabaenales cyanobacterium]
RYRLASAFEGLEVSGYPSATKNAYGAVLKAFLAYSALEQLHKAVKPPSGSRNLMDRWASLGTKPASQLRRSKSILMFLEEQVESRPLLERLHAFQNGESDNCLSVATALRHAVAHGFMSVHPNGTSPQTAEGFCQLVSQMLIEIADHEFRGLVSDLTHQP